MSLGDLNYGFVYANQLSQTGQSASLDVQQNYSSWFTGAVNSNYATGNTTRTKEKGIIYLIKVL